MRLRRLQLRVQTTGGPYGTLLNFPDGLVVIWADNTMGKSTCVKAILVALGMEAMLTANRSDLPLTPAITSQLADGDRIHRVIESEVFLEIENRSGKRITIQRTIKGERDKDLITVHDGPILTSPRSPVVSQDFFVNRQGSASRETGFHHFLAQFLGWHLPTVQTYDGNSYPLYLQCIFPYFMVEQTRGWSTIYPPVPTQFRIRDANKRAIEFLLKLDAHKIVLQRQELALEKTKLESSWRVHVEQIREIAISIGAVSQHLPMKPVAGWPPQIIPSLAISEINNTWISLEQRIQENEKSHALLIQQEIPRVREITATASADLAIAERSVNEREALLARLLDALEQEESEVNRVEQRLVTLEEDIQRNRDVKTLRQLGSSQTSSIDGGHCPVCHQTIQDSLVPLAPEQVVMSLDENIQFLSEQKKTFHMVLSNATRIVASRNSQISSGREELSELRDRVRALRQTLVSDGRLPSIAAIQNRLQLESTIKKSRDALDRFLQVLDGLSVLSKKWKDLQSELLKLPPGDLTSNDKDKLNEWTRLLQEQLAQYGFGSLPRNQITISTDSYLPEHEGFDLQTSISASDLIRTIWSYLSGMLELSRNSETNHPGILIFDEPKQQSTREISFGELLKRASSAGGSNQQVIFFTSENRSKLQTQLSGLDHKFIPIEGKLISKQIN